MLTLGKNHFDDKELLKLLRASGDEQVALREAARSERNKYFGNRLFVRAVIEISNNCDSACLYCGMRRQNIELTRYRLAPKDIAPAIARAREVGVRTLMLQSGQDSGYPVDSICCIIRMAKAFGMSNVILCTGLRNRTDYVAMHAAGANKYILKHETANPKAFARLKPRDTLFRRLRHLLSLREIGFKIGSGCICGLPLQGDKDLLADLSLLRRIQPNMASVSPFIPCDGSPYCSHSPGNIDTTLNVISLFRVLLGPVLLPAVSALETLAPGCQTKGLEAGANVVTLNLTPQSVRADYMIYRRGRKIVDMDHVLRLAEATGMELSDLGEE